MGDAPRSTNSAPPFGPARRRYLTLLFSDLTGSTTLAEAMEAEHYADLLTRLRALYHEVVGKHGGTITRIQGDGMLAIFGYPEAGEDDGRRATEAALDLHHAVRELRTDPPLRSVLSLHSGIHAGLVLLDEGDVTRGRFELVGDAPNIASRLSDAAEVGQIVVSEETLGPASHFFHTSERLLLTLRGRTEPIAVFQIHARARVATRLEARAQRGLAPFVGRQSELRMLEQSLHEVLSGRPAYVTISAPPGLGKTRLVDEFLRTAAAADCQIHRGYCESYLSAEPLQPFLQMLRSLFRIDHGMLPAEAVESLDRTLAAIDPALGAHRGALLRALSLTGADDAGETPSRAASDAAVAALRDLFDRLAAKPVLLFIDDWQWADDATRQVLAAIRALPQRPIFVLTSTRGFAAGDADMSDAHIIELAPLSADEAAETIGRLLPHSHPFVMTEIRGYAGGNPLFIEELCHSAAFEDAEPKLGRVLGTAAWLDVLIESRVARLPAEQAELVRAAAVIGNVIPSWLLESVTGCAEDHPLVQGLAAQDFVFPGDKPGTLRFKHGIAREVIYAAVGLHQRRALHLRIAQAIRGQSAHGAEEEACEALAYHYAAAGQTGDAASFAELAGDKAIAASALDRAQTQYRAALQALDQQVPSQAHYQRWISIAQRMALACVFDPSREPLEVLHRAVALASAQDDQAAIASSEYWLGYINYALGESRAASHHCERALIAARLVHDDPLIVQIRATLGQARAAACDYGRALELLEEAIVIKRRHRSGRRPAVGLSYSLVCKASVLGDQGLFAQAHTCFDEALDALHSAQHEIVGSLLCWRGAVLLWQGRWDDAEQTALEAHRVASRVKSLYVFAMSRAIAGYASWVKTRAPEALQTVIDATAWLEARDKGLYISLNYGWLADGMAASGRYREARQYAARALARTRKDDRLGEAMAYRALARAAAAGQGGKSPMRYMELAMHAAHARGSPHEMAVNRLRQAEIALAAGDSPAAAALLNEAGAAFDAMGMAWHRTQVDRLERGVPSS
ncbi:MAG TPA: AAA family ATPase [Rhizobacter sp.]|nr:AAA family ATPase [Rhizobacter sp.]